ncbi:hypothetical protein CAC42_3723 [Sphaceloma murrayae]|uniref:Uncharacterized protein n=1 Tax=Sphaceloma murrayae TaxID=2082308 RepID=A0A2K1QGZ7_9PEZI|nr:hypothetical protein CAC42_3723 [Sphaceloma murrayae]
MSQISSLSQYASSASATAMEVLVLHVVVLSVQLVLWYLTLGSAETVVDAKKELTVQDLHVGAEKRKRVDSVLDKETSRN